MKKYVIALDTSNDHYWAYREILGMWGIMTYIPGTCSSTAEECEAELRKIVYGKNIKEKEVFL